MTGKGLLLAALTLVTIAYLGFWTAHALRRRREGGVIPGPIHFGIGFVTNFFDTLGIGSFATTTSMYKLWKLVPDQQIPGTLNVGHAANAIAQTFIYLTIVEVEMQTLALMILSAVGGSWLGAGIVAGLPRRKIQIGMGSALLVAAVLMTITAIQAFSPSVQVLPPGGTALGLE
ncbi:MAG: TSUP family transporter, partial [Steroidobacteraceae bacterium]